MRRQRQIEWQHRLQLPEAQAGDEVVAARDRIGQDLGEFFVGVGELHIFAYVQEGTACFPAEALRWRLTPRPASISKKGRAVKKSMFAPEPPLRPTSFHATLTPGNGHSYFKIEDDAQRLARMDATIEMLQQALETQFKRIATLQAQVDRFLASKEPPR